MTELPPKVENPDFSVVEAKLDQYVVTLENGGDVSEFPLRIFELVAEAYRPQEIMVEGNDGPAAHSLFVRWCNEQIALKKARKDESSAQADVERKARVKADIEAFEAERGKPIDILAQEMAEIVIKERPLTFRKGSQASNPIEQ